MKKALLVIIFSIHISNFSYAQYNGFEIFASFGLGLTGDTNTEESISDIWPIYNNVPNEEKEVFMFKYSTPSPFLSIGVNKFLNFRLD